MSKYLMFLVIGALVYCATLPTAVVSEVTESTLRPVPIISQDSHIDPEGSFKWSYESADGTKAEQTGEIKALDKEVVETIVGSYSYQDPEGKTHQVQYLADENGFQPSGDDIAPEIIRNLEYIASHPQPINTEETS